MTQHIEKERAEFLQMHADFEREFGPMPQDCKWSGRGFYQTSHHAWQAQEYAHKFDGFKAAWQAARRAPVVPDGYALISKDALRAWGKLDIVEAACVFPISETPQPSEFAQKKTAGMVVQALAGEIIEALLADEKDGGYALTSGLFGPAFSKLVRRWAAAEMAGKP